MPAAPSAERGSLLNAHTPTMHPSTSVKATSTAETTNASRPAPGFRVNTLSGLEIKKWKARPKTRAPAIEARSSHTSTSHSRVQIYRRHDRGEKDHEDRVRPLPRIQAYPMFDVRDTVQYVG